MRVIRHGFACAALWLSVAMLIPPRAGALACGIMTIPSLFVQQRAFATPVAAADHDTLRFWLDSDGSGFIFDDVARKYGTLSDSEKSAHARSRLPLFTSSTSIPPLLANGGTLGVLSRSDVSGDPIFAGLVGQLGASWLQKRVWTFDYERSRLLWRCNGTEPMHQADEEIALSFQTDASGRLMDGLQYPQLTVSVDGVSYLASLDTAATVALSQSGLLALPKGGAVRATSFVTHALASRWHAAHPRWHYLQQAGQTRGIAAIRVPAIEAGPVRFHDVWFTTRPGDDVFEGEKEGVKLGPSAFGCCVLTIDYPRRRVIFQKR